MATFTNTKLADGQLAATKGTLYTVPATGTLIAVSIYLFNTNTTTEIINLYLKDATTRQVAKISLLANEYAEVILEKAVVPAAGLIEGDTTVAAKVNYWVSGVLVT